MNKDKISNSWLVLKQNMLWNVCAQIDPYTT